MKEPIKIIAVAATTVLLLVGIGTISADSPNRKGSPVLQHIIVTGEGVGEHDVNLSTGVWRITVAHRPLFNMWGGPNTRGNIIDVNDRDSRIRFTLKDVNDNKCASNFHGKYGYPSAYQTSFTAIIGHAIGGFCVAKTNIQPLTLSVKSKTHSISCDQLAEHIEYTDQNYDGRHNQISGDNSKSGWKKTDGAYYLYKKALNACENGSYAFSSHYSNYSINYVTLKEPYTFIFEKLTK